MRLTQELNLLIKLHIPYLIDAGVCINTQISTIYPGEYFIRIYDINSEWVDIKDDIIPLIELLKEMVDIQSTLQIVKMNSEIAEYNISKIDDIKIDKITSIALWFKEFK